MKKILLVVALTALTTTAFAADLKPYIQGSIGYMGIDDLKGNNHVDPKWTSKVDSDITYGIEAGLKDILLPGLRLSISDDYVNAKVKSDNTSIASVNVYQANAYYDFKTSSAFTPYVGVGIGGYKNNRVRDHELAASVKAGVNYNFNQNVYAGLKATYFYLDDSKGGKSDIESLNTYSLNAVLGYQF
jgi:opacity protein-like surface antigen